MESQQRADPGDAGNSCALATPADVMATGDFREPGQRPRDAYHFSAAGRELAVTIQAMPQWGEVHTASKAPYSIVFGRSDGDLVCVGFVDKRGNAVANHDVVPVGQ